MQEALAVRRSWLAASHQQAAAVLAMARAFASLERSSQVLPQLPALDCVLPALDRVLCMGRQGLPPLAITHVIQFGDSDDILCSL